MPNRPDRRRRIALLLAASALLSAVAACATAVGPPPPPQQEAVMPPGRTERGLALVSRECARCHAIGAADQSAAALAPPFRTLAATLSGPALENRLRITSELGHFEMRPAGLEAADLRDVAAYIDGLD